MMRTARYDDGKPVLVHGQSVVIGAIAGVLITLAISAFLWSIWLRDY